MIGNNVKERRGFFVAAFCGTFLAGIIVTEVALRLLVGLGAPIIYDSSPFYGYRPLPNTSYRRILGAKIDFNNLSLRTESEWDQKTDDKILFLGDSVTYGGAALSNEDLFSHLVNKDFDGYKTGNAGVNAWGVENIYGLVVECAFVPAKIYVTTLIEEDFYRGLTRLQGLPFHNIKPKCALHELWQNFCTRQNNKQYRSWKEFAGEKEKGIVVEKAVKKLRAMEQFLEERGCRHLLLISPERKQVLEGAGKDEIVRDLLGKYGLSPVYIVDEMENLQLSVKDKEEIFRDDVHLGKKGHEIWARIIAKELKKDSLD